MKTTDSNFLKLFKKITKIQSITVSYLKRSLSIMRSKNLQIFLIVNKMFSVDAFSNLWQLIIFIFFATSYKELIH